LWKATISLILLILSYVFKDRTTKKWLRIASLILILWEVGQLLYSMFFVKKLTGQQTANPGILQAPGLPPNFDPGKYVTGTQPGLVTSVNPPKTYQTNLGGYVTFNNQGGFGSLLDR